MGRTRRRTMYLRTTRGGGKRTYLTCRWKVMSLLKSVFMTPYPRAHADDWIIWVRMLRGFGPDSQIGMTPWLWERQVSLNLYHDWRRSLISLFFNTLHSRTGL